MKNVETTTEASIVILVTGFGAFPGAPTNSSGAILDRLNHHRNRLASLGIRLETRVLPVVFDQVGAVLEAAARGKNLDAVLHLGLASRRRGMSVETRALNRAGPLHPDAEKRLTAQVIAPGAPFRLKATYPAPRIAAAMRAAGVAASPSNDAGDYVCNTTLYLTLAGSLAPRAGFLHVPKISAATMPGIRARRARPTLDALTRGVLAALLVLARETHRDRVAAGWPPIRPRRDVASAHRSPPERGPA